MQREDHLHDDVEGKVEQQVADADSQQVGGEVVGSLDEAVSSSASRGRQINQPFVSCMSRFVGRTAQIH